MLKNSKNSETRGRTRVFGVKERQWRKRCQQGVPVGPRRVCGAARGWAAPPGLLGQGWTPLVSHRYFPMALYLEIFILNFLGNFTVENFSKFKKMQKLS